MTRGTDGGVEEGRLLEAMNRMLRIAAQDNNVLRRETFEALASALAEYVPLDCMAVVVPEPGGKRLFAATVPESKTPVPPYGVRFPHGPKEETVLQQGKTKICDDTRSSETLDQIAVQWGFLSYVILPIWERSTPTAGARADGARIVAKLVIAFRETGCASKAPLGLLQLLADLFGQTFSRAIELGRERRLAMILETSGDSMIAWDREGKITDANAAAALLTGIPREQLLGMRIGELFDPNELLDATSVRNYAVRTTLRRRDGASITVSVTLNAVEDDPLVSMHALVRDESHVVAKEREASLHFTRVRELEKELRAILDNAPLIVFRLDPEEGKLRYLNRHAERLLGVPTAEALGTPDFLRAVHQGGAALQAFDAAVAAARAGRVAPPYEARLRWNGGDEIGVRGTIYPLVGEGGDVVAIEGILADVSAEHAARSRAVQADRLSSLGMLAASVAHEINNPAAFILLGLGTLERMVRTLEPPAGEEAADGMRDLLGELRDSINRIVRIARDLRVFASPSRGPVKSAITDVNEVVESALSLTRGKVLEHATLVKELEDVPPVLIDGGRLGQVVVNVIVNATQALQKSPKRPATISVTTRSDGQMVEIAIADTGIGIPKENQQRIWAPFFTTKPSEMGTGLGLSISREIVERAGGSIRVESPTLEDEDGPRGARFVIALPTADRRSEREHAPVERALVAADGGAPRRSVLIVEDEVPLARVLSAELGRVHEVVLADCARDAAELLEQRRFDVVLCDLRMPGMSGEAFYSRVRERDPAQASAFIFMSGIGFVPEVERFLAATGRPVLHKPFSPEAVLEAIARLPLPRA